jgi:hypothetical protein
LEAFGGSVSNAKIPARSGGKGKLCRGIPELRAGAVTEFVPVAEGAVQVKRKSC